MARPLAQLKLTEEQIVELASIGCADDEIASLAGVAERTLQARFRTHLTAGRAQLRERLRRKQIDRALAGSDTMLIWLGKQYLDQRDKTEHSGDPERPLVFGAAAHSAAVTDLAPRSVPDIDAPGADEGGGDGEALG